MSQTVTIIARVHETFESAGSEAQIGGLTEVDVLRLGKSRMDQARRLISATVSVEAAMQAARLLGECYRMTSALGMDEQVNETKSLLAHAIGRMIAPNRDECRRHASRLFEELAKDARNRRDRKTEAIEYTNAALCLMELHNFDQAEIAKADKLCRKTISMREKNSVDWAYSQMNLALAQRMALPLKREPDRRANYGHILKGLDRGFAVFRKNPGEPVNFRSAYHINVIDTLESWLDYEAINAMRRMDAEAFARQSGPTNPSGLEAGEYCNVLRVNPPLLGFDQTPSWVPTEVDALREGAAAVERLEDRLARAEKFVEASPRSNSKLKLKIFALRGKLSLLHGDPLPPWDALDSLWHRGDYELYFIYAARFIGGNSEAKADEQDRYRELLKRVSECIVTFRSSWTPGQLSGLLERNPMTFRLTACEMAHLGEWEIAFHILENSRGLNSSRSWSEDPMAHSGQVDDVSWVHVTHSPTASYVVIRNGDSYGGMEFRDLSGKTILPYFHKLGGMDLTDPGRGKRPQIVRLVDEVASLFRPLGDFISEQSRSRVVLMPGGFYQAFPIWACGKLGDDLTEQRKQVTSAPSRTIAMRNSEVNRAGNPRRTVFVASASDVPGLDPLAWSKHEAQLIQDALGSKLHVAGGDATQSVVSDHLRTSGIFHFTGHSSAGMDPKDSALVTYNGPVSVANILDLNCSCGLAFFGSCESGLAKNFVQQDEMLSIQTATYYAGAETAIGTTWPVWDPPAFYFASRFYGHLSTASDPTSSEVFIAAYAAAMGDTRRATNRDLRQLGHEFGLDQVPPDNSVPAFSFVDWAAFGLVGVDSSSFGTGAR
ncbi:CHAT domain-containing protein [Rhodococcus sp. IEGM 1408]|uniref:CHAT domain-containing protein n=1 Tax=Rhodococcus sp. IEGM 1408 TaxID=3082220 RepID=UPI002952DDBF|nr:CHAT domain-containing protein [Rhodococcus sp. IEGM 1408]MDV8001048.1 CHAT domain-containing protein [Rhodococcus sp. IEGM 1408]